MKYIVLFFILSGCALSPAERWYQATGISSSVVIIEKDNITCHGDKTDGCYYKSSNIIIIKRNLDDGTLLHEFGHQFTRKHLITGQRGNMVNSRTNMSWTPCITKDDLYLVCSEVNCSKFNPEC